MDHVVAEERLSPRLLKVTMASGRVFYTNQGGFVVEVLVLGQENDAR